MIRLTDPTRVGQALAEVRQLQGMSRPACAREIAKLTGRGWRSINSQLWTWDTGACRPTLEAIGPYLTVLGLILAVDFEDEAEENP